MKVTLKKLKRLVISSVWLFVFAQGCAAIIMVQVVVKRLYSRNLEKLQSGLNFTKNAFILLLVSILAIIAPSSVRILTDNKTIPAGTFYFDREKGRIASHLDQKSVMISNHQIYTDWIYLWWLAYTSNLGGNIYIMLKKSLEAIPMMGYGMTNYGFIFLTRKWSQDRIILRKQLTEIEAGYPGKDILLFRSNLKYKLEPDSRIEAHNISQTSQNRAYCFLVYPEGTTMCANGREKAEKYAKKVGREPFRHLLLPHTTGLRFTLSMLNKSINTLYDITIGYSELKADEYGEDIYSLSNLIMKGKVPKLTDIYIRAYKLNDIPFEDEEKFTEWLYNIWTEKDNLLDTYYRIGSFGLPSESTHTIIDTIGIRFREYYTTLFPPLIFGFMLISLSWSYFYQESISSFKI